MLIFHFIYLLKIHEYLYYRISFPYKIYRIFSELYQTFIYKFSRKGKLNGLGGSISTLFDERMNQNIKLEIAPCRRYLISEDVDSIDVARLLFPFIRRYSRRASSRRRIDGKKKKREISPRRKSKKLPCYFSSNTVEGGRRVKRTRNRDAS